MNRKEFYDEYRQARFLMKARVLYSTQKGVKDPGSYVAWLAIENTHKSVRYAILNRHPETHHPITEHRWAIKSNSKF